MAKKNNVVRFPTPASAALNEIRLSYTEEELVAIGHAFAQVKAASGPWLDSFFFRLQQQVAADCLAKVRSSPDTPDQAIEFYQGMDTAFCALVPVMNKMIEDSKADAEAKAAGDKVKEVLPFGPSKPSEF